MHDSVIRKRILTLGLLWLITVSIWWQEFSGGKFLPPNSCHSDFLCIIFLDVGQGDAIFIQSPSGKQLLIDAGRPDGSVLRELGKVMDWRDRALDFVLLTHPDADHIGGFPEVLARYEVAHVIRTENNSDTDIWRTTERAIIESEAKIHFARRGQRYQLGHEVYLEILFPDTDTSTFESNKASIVAKLIYGNTSFMLTGDSPKSIEEYLVLIEGEHLKSDVLKVGHHGSRTSTSELFISHVQPKYAVISAGKDNSYGHPHLEVTDLLFNFEVNTLNTAESGRVVFWSDGTDVHVR